MVKKNCFVFLLLIILTLTCACNQVKPSPEIQKKDPELPENSQIVAGEVCKGLVAAVADEQYLFYVEPSNISGNKARIVRLDRNSNEKATIYESEYAIIAFQFYTKDTTRYLIALFGEDYMPFIGVVNLDTNIFINIYDIIGNENVKKLAGEIGSIYIVDQYGLFFTTYDYMSLSLRLYAFRDEEMMLISDSVTHIVSGPALLYSNVDGIIYWYDIFSGQSIVICDIGFFADVNGGNSNVVVDYLENKLVVRKDMQLLLYDIATGETEIIMNKVPENCQLIDGGFFIEYVREGDGFRYVIYNAWTGSLIFTLSEADDVIGMGISCLTYIDGAYYFSNTQGDATIQKVI